MVKIAFMVFCWHERFLRYSYILVMRAPAPLRTNNTAHCPLHCPLPTALPTAHCTTHCTAHCNAHVHCPMYCPLPTALPTLLPTAMAASHCTVHCAAHCNAPCTAHCTAHCPQVHRGSTLVSCGVHHGTMRDPPGVLWGFHEGSTRGPFGGSPRGVREGSSMCPKRVYQGSLGEPQLVFM